MTQLTNAYLAAVLAALAIGFVEQALLPGFVSRNTVWGLAPGWQREIGFWNIGLAVVIGEVLWSKDPASARVVVIGVVALTALLGTNHLFAGRSNRQAWMHRVGAIVNYLAVGVGVLVLWP